MLTSAVRDPAPPTPAAVVLDGEAHREVLGGKGAALDRLIGWGLPVPPAGAVTTDAYRRFALQSSIAEVLRAIRAGEEPDAAAVDRVFATSQFGPDDAAAIVAIAREVSGGCPLAVRSSATVEDLDRSSFAGQYHSVLGVDPEDPDSVLDAVRSVYASLWHPAPRSYRAGFGIGDEGVAMAVVLMRMVPAERAGVVFTVDPTGDGTSARIESVAGLGESLVSGRATPVAAVVPLGTVPTDLPEEAAEALDLALRIERRAGCPQDVEWAWDGRRTWIVQARPITVTGAEDGDGFDDPAETLAGLDLTTAGIGEMLPGVLPPLIWGVASPMVEEAFRRLLDDLAVLPSDLVGPRAVVRRVGGRAAMDFGRVQAMAGALPGSAGEELESEYFGSRRAGRAAATVRPSPLGRVRSVTHDLRVLRARHRYAVDAVMLRRATEAVARRQARPERARRRAAGPLPDAARRPRGPGHLRRARCLSRRHRQLPPSADHARPPPRLGGGRPVGRPGRRRRRRQRSPRCRLQRRRLRRAHLGGGRAPAPVRARRARARGHRGAVRRADRRGASRPRRQPSLARGLAPVAAAAAGDPAALPRGRSPPATPGAGEGCAPRARRRGAAGPPRGRPPSGRAGRAHRGGGGRPALARRSCGLRFRVVRPPPRTWSVTAVVGRRGTPRTARCHPASPGDRFATASTHRRGNGTRGGPPARAGSGAEPSS